MEMLLQEIARCPNVQFCIKNPSVEHPCHEIVFSQSSSTLGNHQIPETWSGHIEKVPILFISSNPSISSLEEYPRWSWSGDAIDDYFNNRFSDGRKTWILDGTKALQEDGTYSRSVRFWLAVRQRATELLERKVTPGIDYAITEIVHCKSRNEIGVIEAQKECVPNYLRKVLEIASAQVVVVLGVRAKKAILTEFTIPQDTTLSVPTVIGQGEKFITFLPHPNARTIRSFSHCLKPGELETLRAFLRGVS